MKVYILIMPFLMVVLNSYSQSISNAGISPFSGEFSNEEVFLINKVDPLTVFSSNDEISLQAATVDVEAEFQKAVASLINNRLGVKVYPNPATNLLFVEGLKKGFYVKIFDLQGNRHLSKKFGHANKMVDVQNLEPGIYMMLVEKGDDNKMFKFIKK